MTKAFSSMISRTPPSTYRQAGVDIEAGESLVEMIKPAAAASGRAGVIGGLGGFGAMFDLKAAGFRDPVLVSCTDGVGTKLMVATETGLHEAVGIDLVAMCVNDLVVHGAEPLFFLDYFATGKLELEAAARVVRGIAEGCRLAGCALVGGETAEMPGMYGAGHYDLAGFAVGAAERGALLPSNIAAGDMILGLPSSGVHANGFSLVRRVVREAGLGWDAPCPYASGISLGRALMTPTRLYVHATLALHRAGLLKGAAHITGGGLPGNLPRILPDGLAAAIDAEGWMTPPVFGWLARTGAIDSHEMLRVFNCGIGMALVVNNVASATALLSELGEAFALIGRIEAAADQAPRIRFTALPDFAA